jgi:ribosomal protein L11 methyltransferase
LNTTPLWKQTEIIALFPEKTDIQKIINFLQEQIQKEFINSNNKNPSHDRKGVGIDNAYPLAYARGSDSLITYQVELLEDQNWERAWLEHFKPMRFGQRLWICPSTEIPPDPTAVNIILDPGLAFGTGTHPTTALCLEWLDQNNIQNKTVIDYGCGSGILAIAALKLGAKEVWAIDYDPQALEATQENARRNDIDQNKLHVIFPEKVPTVKIDILLANILANPLIELAPRFAELIKPHGHLVLSGILENQITAITEAYQEWFQIMPVIEQEGWVRIEGIRLS